MKPLMILDIAVIDLPVIESGKIEGWNTSNGFCQNLDGIKPDGDNGHLTAFGGRALGDVLYARKEYTTRIV